MLERLAAGRRGSRSVLSGLRPRVRRSRTAVARSAFVQQLETRCFFAGSPVITEFLANNNTGIVDGNNAHSDWIEIQNQGDASMDLVGYHLTDDATNPAKWTFPSKTITPGQYILVFSDGTNVVDPAGYLHTSFSLSTTGEQLELTDPSGTVLSGYGPGGTNYPKQFPDISYGTSTIQSTTTILTKGSTAKALAPTSAALDSNLWTVPSFNDAAWRSGTTGVGFDGGGTASTSGLLAKWTGQSLTGVANGTVLTTWTAVGTTNRATNSSTGASPTVLTNAINGLPVVHFDGSNDQLKNSTATLNGLSNFTMAAVFRTSTLGRSGTQWYNNTGIVDGELGGVTNDWGMALDSAGHIGAGIGNADYTLYSAQTALADGLPHSIIYVKNGTSLTLSIDGGAPVSYAAAPAAARGFAQMTFGSINTNIQYFAGDLAEVRVYSVAMTNDSARSLSQEMGTTWGIPQLAGAYTSSINLDLKADMAGLATTAAVRVPFTITGSNTFQGMTLNMKYDDGFVAYLNGTEIARRNAPATVTYTSTATAVRDDAAALVNEAIDVGSYSGLIQGNGAQNVLAIRMLNSSLTDSDLLCVPELVATRTVGTGSAYMKTPTPGAANVAGYTALAGTVTFSVPHGFYSATFTTTLTAPTLGSTLIYTTDGSDPTLSNGTVIAAPANGTSLTTATVSVSHTTTFRAVAFRDTYLPSENAPVSYLFAADIVTQPETTPSGAYWDVGMNTGVVNATQTYSVAQALVSTPSLSITLPYSDMFGTGGIYANPKEYGDDWERAIGTEYIDPSDPTDSFTVNAGIRIEGGVSRDPSRPKKSFQLYFRADYGASQLDFPIFGSTGETAFDHLVLRGGHSYTWANLGGDPYQRADYLRDEFGRDTQNAEGANPAPRDKWTQLYINGQYWGIYDLTEQIDQTWAAAQYGGNADDYDIIKPNDAGGVQADSGLIDDWNSLSNTFEASYADGVISSSEYTTLSGMVDMKGLADYILDVFYRGDNDAPVLIGSSTSPRNFLAVHDRVTNSKWEFESWDGEISMDTVTYNRTLVYGNQNPARYYQQLRTNPEFAQLFQDEVARLMTGNGALTPAANQARYLGEMAHIDRAIVGESARWGNAKQTTSGMRDTNWVTETSWIVNTYMPQRTDVVIGQLKAQFPDLSNNATPSIFINGTASFGGSVVSGSSLTMTNANGSPAGVIYYTLDGTDPRLTGGAVSTNALTYSSAIPIPSARHLKARVYRNNTWSPLVDDSFTVTPPLLRLAEMQYHPPNAGAGSPYVQDDFEFIELANIGSIPIDLAGMTLSGGIAGTFAATGAVIPAGGRGLVVRNIAAFQYIYGTSPLIVGTYTGKLKDSSDTVTMFDPNSGVNLFSFTYQDSWYPTTDGTGYTMVVNDLNPAQTAATILGAASAWHASTNIGGTPGFAEGYSSISGRRLFYNNSSFDGNNSSMGAADDAAIATDKTALLPGGTSTFSNYTGFSKGINGIMVDVAGLNQEEVWQLTAADLGFQISDTSSTPVFTNAAVGATMQIRRGAGVSGSDRISLTWADNAIAGRWLKVTVLANGRTGLSGSDVFYFGNAPGDTGNSTTDAYVTSADELGARNNPRTFANPAGPTFVYDFNRDGKVNATDELIARNNGTGPGTALPLFGAPSLPGAKGSTSGGGTTGGDKNGSPDVPPDAVGTITTPPLTLAPLPPLSFAPAPAPVQFFSKLKVPADSFIPGPADWLLGDA